MKFMEASISVNNKRMDESDVSAPVASPAATFHTSVTR